MTEDELRRLLRADADRARDPEVVWAGVERGLRRRRRREGVAAGAAVLALAAALVGVAVVDLPDPAPDDGPVATAPAPSPTTTPTTTPLDPAAVPSTPADARRAFAGAGYTAEDAEALGDLWQWGDVDDVVVVAGADLLAGAELPLAPGEAPAAADAGGARPGFFDDIAAFGAAGWSGADAERLARAWDEDPATVTLHVGHLALEGRLPGSGAASAS